MIGREKWERIRGWAAGSFLWTRMILPASGVRRKSGKHSKRVFFYGIIYMLIYTLADEIPKPHSNSAPNRQNPAHGAGQTLCHSPGPKWPLLQSPVPGTGQNAHALRCSRSD